MTPTPVHYSAKKKTKNPTPVHCVICLCESETEIGLKRNKLSVQVQGFFWLII